MLLLKPDKKKWQLIRFLAAALFDLPIQDNQPLTPTFQSRYELFVRNFSPLYRLVLRTNLFFINLLPLFYKAKTFRCLSAQQQKSILKSWSRHPFIGFYLMLRPWQAFLGSVIYSDPQLESKLGFQEPSFVSMDQIPPKRAASSALLDSEKSGPLKNSSDGIGNSPKIIDVECCVIGSGAGGAVIAKTLAQNGHEVLILEEGVSQDLSQFRTLPTLERNILMYRDGGMVTTLGFPPIVLPTGKCVGGTTIINSGTCFRTPEAVFQEWTRRYGLSSSLSSELKPHFESVEHILQVQPVIEENLGTNNQMIRRGLEALNLHGGPLIRNAAGCQGAGVCIFGCPNGAKQSMERSFLPMAYEAGARIITGCRVERLKKKGDRIISLDARINGEEVIVRAQKFFICAGTLETPLLLQRSKLQGKSGQVGNNLTIHPTAKIIGRFDELMDGHRGVPQGYSMTDMESEGLMFETVFFPPWLLATSVHLMGEAHRKLMESYRHLGIFGFLVHDEGGGQVRSSPSGRPLIYYRLGDKELRLFQKGIQVLGDILFAAGAREVFPTVRTIDSCDSWEQWKKIDFSSIKRHHLESAAFHPLGTCRMGPDPKTSVVDESLQHHQIENLWIADGSIFPTSLGVNPQISIMAFAERCAQQFGNKNKNSASMKFLGAVSAAPSFMPEKTVLLSAPRGRVFSGINQK